MGCIAIIPARSGSKGLKDKNIKLLNGKPLIAYSIEAAINSGCFDTVHVSTDSEFYANIARHYGTDEPFLRDVNNSADKSSTWDAVKEVLRKYKEIGKEFDTFMLLQPTSPLRTVADIKGAFEVYAEKNADAIVAVCESDHSPILINNLPNDYSMQGFLKADVNKARRQDFDAFYRINGAMYLSKVNTFLADSNIYNSNCYAYIMRKENSVDIDDAIDFAIAEAMISSDESNKKVMYFGSGLDTAKMKSISKISKVIESGNIDSLPTGTYSIDNKITLSILDYDTKEFDSFEYHNNHVDVHYVILGEEIIQLSDTEIDESKYDSLEDGGLSVGEITGEVKADNEKIIIIDKRVLHKPGIPASESGKVRKAVFKIEL